MIDELPRPAPGFQRTLIVNTAVPLATAVPPKARGIANMAREELGAGRG